MSLTVCATCVIFAVNVIISLICRNVGAIGTFRYMRISVTGGRVTLHTKMLRIYRGTSRIRNSAPLGPYSRTMPRSLCTQEYRVTSLIRDRHPPPRTTIGAWAWSYCRVLRGGVFFPSEVPLYSGLRVYCSAKQHSTVRGCSTYMVNDSVGLHSFSIQGYRGWHAMSSQL